MFRLANEPFKSEPGLHKLATYVLTESIKNHLSIFFEEGWQEASPDEWMDYVREGKVLSLIPDELENELLEAGIAPEPFFNHKVTQMMEQLMDPEPITFDLLGEYILAKMIHYFEYWELSYPAKTIDAVIPELKAELWSYYQAMEDYEKDFDEEDRVGYNAKRDTERVLKALTDVKSFLSSESFDDSFIFWDADYTLIDDWGLGAVLKACQDGLLASRGYDTQEVERMVGGLI